MTGVGRRIRQPSLVALADRLGRRHVGAVLGRLDLASDRIDMVGRGRVSLLDGASPGRDTLFEIGSITKTFTSLALAVLVRSGTVSLGMPLRELLPPGTAVPSRDNTEITLEHLARHTSGLPRSHLPLLHELKVVRRGGNPYDMDESSLLESLSRVSLKRTPGRGHGTYSNLGGALLGIALCRAAGAGDYEELVRATVLEPLRLSDTVVRPRADQAGRLAQGHGMRRRPVDPWYLEGMAGAGALRSTAADVLRYLEAQLEPDRTPLAEAIRLTRQLLEPERRTTIGLGWIRTELPGGDMWWHNGGTGGFRSFAGFSPELGQASVVLVNDVRSPDRAGVQALPSLRRRPARRGSGD
jgi:D-alanyl-D-alanine-carboxypeptidase/D-alanyl-D-alanine-endopeptidase